LSADACGARHTALLNVPNSKPRPTSNEDTYIVTAGWIVKIARNQHAFASSSAGIPLGAYRGRIVEVRQMRSYQMTSTMKRVAGLGGVGALVLTYGCGGAQTPLGTRASFAQEGPAQAPVVVTCEPNQRTLVRPALVNGAAVSQVECVSIGQASASMETPAPVQRYAAPAQYRASAPRPLEAPRAVYDDREIADTQVLPVSYPAQSSARPVRTEQVVYDDRPVRTVRPVRRAPVRSATKSAVIIGSSAGAGAGVGAAIGGKKGALIGAVLGGGGATLWDQVTRRRN
jgi:hypothetical protein